MKAISTKSVLVLRLAEPIGQRLGTGGLNIATRVMGLILAAMVVQFMADGMLDLFPGLGQYSIG